MRVIPHTQLQKSKHLSISHVIDLVVLTAWVAFKRGDTSNDAIDNRFSRLVNNITSRAENETNEETKAVRRVEKGQRLWNVASPLSRFAPLAFLSISPGSLVEELQSAGVTVVAVYLAVGLVQDGGV